jgi:hypothetical protein
MSDFTTSSRRLILATTLLVLCLGTPSRGGIMVNLTETAGNVVATGSGTINLTDLTYSYSGGTSAYILPSSADFNLGGAAGSSVDVYTLVTGPTSFGAGGYSIPTSGSGPVFGIYESSGYLEVPAGYVSASLLSATDTYSGANFSSLGLTPGTYTWTWGTGANADFFTMNIGVSSVPEPSSLLLAFGGAGIVALAALAHRRRAT